VSERPDKIGNDDDAPSAAVILAVMAVLVVSGYYLTIKLYDMGHKEDCEMSGRRNCAPIGAPAR
jgi:hypothetical protein